MDEQTAVKRVLAEYEKLVQSSPRIRALEKKLADGTITMKEGAELNDLRAKAFGRALSGSVTGIERGRREGACVSLLKDRCADVDELALAAQKTALTRQGLNLTPPTAPFEEDRARKIGRSLEDETVPDETIQRRARSASETMLRSQYDRDMERGAKTCSDAGLRTYIVRDADPGCCAWCSAAAGRYTYGSEPKDVYRRHDNCSCSVVYESGRGRQNVWSKQTWSKEQEREYLELRDELKAKKRTEAPNVKKPVRLSEKDIQAIIAKVGGLTIGQNGVIINTDKKVGSRTSVQGLSPNAQKYLEKLKKYGDNIRGKSTDFTMRELAEMSRATGVEFGKIIIGEESVLTRGDAQGTFFSEKILQEAFSKHGVFEYHSHPYDDDLSPSKSDEYLLRLFDERVGQKTSKIVAPNNKFSVFSVDGVAYVKSLEADNSIDEEYANELMRIFGGDFDDNN